MARLFNLARVTTATTGTGTITLGSAVSGYLTFALAGVANGDVVSYGIKDGANSEVGTGTYTSSGATLTRTVTKSTNSNAAISLSGSAEVFITARAEDLGSEGQHPGTATNDNAAAGNVGEHIASSSAVSLVSGAAKNVTSISLTAGDWDVTGVISFAGTGSTTVQQMSGGISQTTNTLPTFPGGGYFRQTIAIAAGGADNVLPTGVVRISLSGTTTVYLVAQAVFAASTLSASGYIGARRMR